MAKKKDIFEEIRLELNRQMLGEDNYTDLGIYTHDEVDEITPAEMGFMRLQMAA